MCDIGDFSALQQLSSQRNQSCLRADLHLFLLVVLLSTKCYMFRQLPVEISLLEYHLNFWQVSLDLPSIAREIVFSIELTEELKGWLNDNRYSYEDANDERDKELSRDNEVETKINDKIPRDALGDVIITNHA